MENQAEKGFMEVKYLKFWTPECPFRTHLAHAASFDDSDT